MVALDVPFWGPLGLCCPPPSVVTMAVADLPTTPLPTRKLGGVHTPAPHSLSRRQAEPM